MELTEQEIQRQDLVDNAIYTLLQTLNPTTRTIEWNIELIGKVRDAVSDVLVDDLALCSERDFYPFVEER